MENPQKRCKTIQQFLKPLRPRAKSGVEAVFLKMVSHPRRRDIVLAVSEQKLGNTYRDWFFRTSHANILCQYFEEWKASSTENWELRQACLHFFWIVAPREAPEEIVALHCEPKELGGDVKAKLKRGPHVHIRKAGSPLSHSHFPLNFGQLESVMASLDSLTSALMDAFEICRQEILNIDWHSK